LCRHFLLGGNKGHVALVDALRLDVVRELHLGESVRDVKVSTALILWLPGDRLEVASESDYCVSISQFLHNETMFAVAQRKYVYIYDNQVSHAGFCT
jgi:U3 small nucleolar RNA-associated protein 7